MKNAIWFMLMVTSLSAQAGGLTIPADKSADLQKACMAKVSAKGSKVVNGLKSCTCFVGKVSEMYHNEQTADDATKDLTWTIRFTAGSISPSELDADPLNMIEQILDFERECLHAR